MFIFFIVLIGIIAVMITLIILIQSGKGGGLAGIAAGGATTQILGARQAPDVLEKATWTLAALFIILCILSNFVIDRTVVEESVIQQRAQGDQTEQTAPLLPPPTQAPSTQQELPPGEDGPN